MIRADSPRGRALVLAVVGIAACKTKSLPAPSTESSAPSAVAAPAAAASSASAPEHPWYAGKWSGSYHAEIQPIVMQRSEGMVPAWAADDGKSAAGLGKIELEIDANGLAQGRSEGPLGVQDATGMVDHDTLRVSLAPQAIEPAKAFHGFLVATRSGNGISGNLQASSGDSLVVRKATVELERH